MAQMTNRWTSSNLLAIVFLQLIFCLTVLFDIPIARQIIGFLYITFLPGFLLIQLLGVDWLSTAELITFSVGLSIALTMLIGFLANGLFPAIGMLYPLSSIPLLFFLSAFVLTGTIVGFLMNVRVRSFNLTLPNKDSLFLLFVTMIPIVSAIGACWVSLTGSNSLLLIVLPLIAMLFLLALFFGKPTSKSYALIVFSITVALLLHSSLVSNYIYGPDINDEFYVFKLTQNNAYWDSTRRFDLFIGRENSMLSDTVLPTIYSNLLNLDGTWVVKLVFPLIFALVPLVLYKLWSTKMRNNLAFASIFLLMSQTTFYTELLGETRQMIGELFFVLLLLIILTNRLHNKRGQLFFVLFAFGLIVSHYALATILLSFIFAVWLYMFLAKKTSKNLTLPLILLVSVMMFAWYIFTSASASFDSIVFFAQYVYRGLNDFFNPTSRGEYVLRGLGLEAAESNWQFISRVFAYATQFLIVIGFIVALIKKDKRKIDLQYFLFSFLGMVLLAMCLLLPRFASTLNMSRFYHIILFFVAPFFVAGCESIIHNFVRHKTEIISMILIVAVLIPYFLFQTGFMYEITRTRSWSVPLSGYRMDRFTLIRTYGFADGQSVFGAYWLSRNIMGSNTKVYADIFSISFQLRSYGGMYITDMYSLSNTTVMIPRSLVYLSQLNVVYGEIVGTDFVYNSTEFSSLINDSSKVYSNGGCDVHILPS